MTYTYQNNIYNIIIMNKAIKNTYIRVKSNLDIVVTTNFWTSTKMVDRLIQANQLKINQMIDKIKAKQVINNDEVVILGKHYQLKYDPTLSEVIIDDYIIKSPNEPALNKYLDLLLNQKAQYYLDYYLRIIDGISYPKLKYRLMTSRWGVCNEKKQTITINKSLVHKDVECLKYVLVHELCHFINFDHSPSFWKKVSQYYPNYKIIKRMLRE